MKHPSFQFLLVGLLVASAFQAAQAHVTLLVGAAAAGAGYRAALRVGHGCEGAPTTELITDLIRVKLETALLVTHKTIMQ